MDTKAKRGTVGKLALWALRFLRLLCVGDGTVLVDSGADSKRSRRQH